MTTMFGSFPNYGFVRNKVPADLLQKLQSEINNLDRNQNKFNLNLAGNIELEYQLSEHRQELEDFILPLCADYSAMWNNKNTSKDFKPDDLELYTYWANIQKKHEFNPMHMHDGVYSFAIWLKVPYNIEDELKSPSVNRSNMPRAGMFSFIYTNIFGEIREAEFPVDRSFEGTIFLFPSCLPHMVYPFTSSNEYRISISGNLRKKL